MLDDFECCEGGLFHQKIALNDQNFLLNKTVTFSGWDIAPSPTSAMLDETNWNMNLSRLLTLQTGTIQFNFSEPVRLTASLIIFVNTMTKPDFTMTISASLDGAAFFEFAGTEGLFSNQYSNVCGLARAKFLKYKVINNSVNTMNMNVVNCRAYNLESWL